LPKNTQIAFHPAQFTHVWDFMASIRKQGKKWRAYVERQGIRRTKVFPSRQEARDWASAEEARILGGAGAASKLKFRDILGRYAREVSPAKRGHRWEVVRIEKLQRDELADKRMCDLEPQDVARWRDRRLREVAPGSVIREMNLLGSIFSVARREWGLIAESPMKDVSKPPQPPRRERLVTQAELERMALVAGEDMTYATARAFAAFRFAIETAMRAGEILSLTRDRVDTTRRVAQLDMTKNGTSREVALSSEAVAIWQALPGGFNLTSRQLDALFRKITGKAVVQGLTFHDSRHSAITRLAKKLHPMDLARMVGHRDLKMLLRYYDESAEEIAKRLD
jgi:integrase